MHQTASAFSSRGPGAKVIRADTQDHPDRQDQQVTSDAWLLAAEIRYLFLFFIKCTLFQPDEPVWAQKGGVRQVRVHGTDSCSFGGIKATSSENKTVLLQSLAQSEQQQEQQGK